MPVYTLLITDEEGGQFTTLSDFPSDEIAISDAGQFVSAAHPSVAVARDFDDQAEFMGPT